MEIVSKGDGSSFSSYSRKRPSGWEYSSVAKRTREDEVSLVSVVYVEVGCTLTANTPCGNSADLLHFRGF